MPPLNITTINIVFTQSMYNIILNSWCNKNVIPPPQDLFSGSAPEYTYVLRYYYSSVRFVCMYTSPRPGSLSLKSCPRRWPLTNLFSVFSIILHSIRIESILFHLLNPSRKIYGRPRFPSSCPLRVSSYRWTL